jgi:hypothetical protein
MYFNTCQFVEKDANIEFKVTDINGIDHYFPVEVLGLDLTGKVYGDKPFLYSTLSVRVIIDNLKVLTDQFDSLNKKAALLNEAGNAIFGDVTTALQGFEAEETRKRVEEEADEKYNAQEDRTKSFESYLNDAKAALDQQASRELDDKKKESATKATKLAGLIAKAQGEEFNSEQYLADYYSRLKQNEGTPADLARKEKIKSIIEARNNDLKRKAGEDKAEVERRQNDYQIRKNAVLEQYFKDATTFENIVKAVAQLQNKFGVADLHDYLSIAHPNLLFLAGDSREAAKKLTDGIVDEATFKQKLGDPLGNMTKTAEAALSTVDDLANRNLFNDKVTIKNLERIVCIDDEYTQRKGQRTGLKSAAITENVSVVNPVGSWKSAVAAPASLAALAGKHSAATATSSSSVDVNVIDATINNKGPK